MSYAVHIHLGAHRTGTSSFQAYLGANRKVLKADGFDLAYPGRDGAAGGKLRLKLPPVRNVSDVQVAERARQTLDNARSGSATAMILSEENIPGIMANFYEGQFYPHAASRLDMLRHVLPGRVGRTVLVIRAYDELFTSAYRLRAAARKVKDFPTLSPIFCKVPNGWAELVETTRDRLRPEALVVLSMAKRKSERNILEKLCPALPGDLDLQDLDSRYNASLEDAELMALQKIFRSDGALSNDDLDRLTAEIKKEGDPVIAQFDDAQTRFLQDRYAEDCDRIAKMAGVEADL